jgi:hypothetical protein
MTMLEQLLEAPANFALKQLVWTASTLGPTTPHQHAEWLEIADFKGRMTLKDGMKIIMLRKDSDPEWKRANGGMARACRQ